jgi:tRNA U34 5-carboxymethylaminomethyl modifying GTPase MnmE/TrmE
VVHGSLVRAIAGVEDGGEDLSEELVLSDIAEARKAFEEVTGVRVAEDVLHHIFSRFCIGK